MMSYKPLFDLILNCIHRSYSNFGQRPCMLGLFLCDFVTILIFLFVKLSLN